MFADSLLETSWAQRTRRSWTTLTSFGVEAAAIGLLLLLPALRTVGLPATRTVSTPITLGRRNSEPIASGPRTPTVGMQRNFTDVRFVQPGRIPTISSMAADDPSSHPSSGSELGSPGVALFSGAGSGLPSSLIGGTRPILPVAAAPSHVIRTSSMLEGNLIRRVEPVYPKLAITARIQGSVTLAAVISKVGTIENLQALSGPPMLVPAAIDAVSKWRYRPYILNSEPIEVETRITVNFVLDGK